MYYVETKTTVLAIVAVCLKFLKHSLNYNKVVQHISGLHIYMYKADKARGTLFIFTVHNNYCVYTIPGCTLRR